MKHIYFLALALLLFSCQKEAKHPTLKGTTWTIIPAHDHTIYLTDDSMTFKWPYATSVMYIKYLTNDSIEFVDGSKSVLRVKNDTLFYLWTYNNSVDKYVAY